MSREKQIIEEMVEVLKGVDRWDHARLGYYESYAHALYNAGYRKQSEGEWRSELVKKCDWKGKKHDYYQPNSCSLCHEAVVKRTPYCPNCGAKMLDKQSEDVTDTNDGRKSEWISVDERLPNNATHIIVCDKDGMVGEAYYFKDGRFEWIADELIAFVTHWMPLPEPPKMKGGEHG